MTNLGSTVPDPGELVRAKVRWAARYVDVGWKVFVLGQDKTPLPNCAECRDADWTHDRESCPCLTCHGFYAATSDLDAVGDMIARHPVWSWLAVRTGAASRLLVLDFEAAPNDQGVTGLDTLDQWESWTGHELPDTLRQRTQSGGLHLLYRLPAGVTVKSRNRILPQTDLKAEGGYVAVPTPGRPEREWLLGRTETDAPGWLLDSLAKMRGTSRGGGSGSGRQHDALYGDRKPLDGYDYQGALRAGCPGGFRDEFFNELLFRTRKAGVSREGAEKLARMHWERCAQPPLTEWYMPWEHVEYKLERMWRTVEPNPPLPSWTGGAVGTAGEVVGKTNDGETIVKQGNTRIVRRAW